VSGFDLDREEGSGLQGKHRWSGVAYRLDRYGVDVTLVERAGAVLVARTEESIISIEL